MVASYEVGDLVWAKMKGFPPWPAKITSLPRTRDVVNGKYSVLFYGTHETAQMKSVDLFPYMEYREQYERSRKMKGFIEGIKEIRSAAGLDDIKPNITRLQVAVANAESETRENSARIRKPSSKISSDDYILPTPRATARMSTRQTQQQPVVENIGSSNISALLNDNVVATTSSATTSPNIPTLMSNNNKRSRLRTDSNCSNGSLNGSGGNQAKRNKRVSYSDRLGLDFNLEHDPVLSSGSDPVFINACLGSNSLSVFDDQEDDKSRARKRTRSRAAYEDFLMSPGKSPFRDRSRSISSNGGRSRLASGYSDAFDDLIDSAHTIFNANELMAAIDQLPSEESDRPITPEEPLPMPAPLKTCYACGCQCQLLGLKWRCTNKQCMKWNGTHQPAFPLSSEVEEDPTHNRRNRTQEQEEIERAVNAIKREASGFEEPHRQQGDELQPHYRRQEQHQLGYLTANIKRETGEPIRCNDPYGDYDQQQQAQYQQMDGQSVMYNNEDEARKARSSRPKSYKVEKTPPMLANGMRLCSLCNGQVRPQMCGGNKHRWRCVDKKCRKWYGWVLSCDEIPNDLGKKGRWRELVLKVSDNNNHQSSSRGDINEPSEEQLAVDSLMSAGTASLHATMSEGSGNATSNNGSNNSIPANYVPPRRIGRPPKVIMADDPNLDKIRTKFPPPQGGEKSKRRYIRRKRERETFEPQRPISPLTLRQMSYEPSSLERHGRWWLMPRRRTDTSPVRDQPTSVLNNAANMRILHKSMLSAAATKADEPGSVSGALDLLMDALMSSMAPLLSLLSKVPGVVPDADYKDTIHRLWDASSIHTPML